MTFTDLNNLDSTALKDELRKCCGSEKWIEEMVASRPFDGQDNIFSKANTAWATCEKNDFLEAFSHHPKIGDTESLKKKYASTAHWAEGEQAGVKETTEEVLSAMAECNLLYDEKFGFIFIINATGKSAEEILGTLRWRLLNTPDDEITIAAEEQNAITHLRLKKLLA